MQAQWDPNAFHEIAQDVGYPSALSPEAVSTVSMLLPADTSPEVRAMVEVMCAAASGFFDDYAVTRAAEMLGLSSELVKELLDVGSTAAALVELDDPVGLALLGGTAALDGLIGACDMILDDCSEKIATLSTILWCVPAVTAALGQLPAALATAIAAAAGFATVEALVAAITALQAAIAGVLTMIQTPLRSLQLAADTLQAALDAMRFVYAEYQADGAEAAGDFARAAKYRELMKDHAFDMLEDMLAATVNALLAVPFVANVRKVGIVVVNLVFAPTLNPLDLMTWKGPGIKEITGAAEIVVDALSDTPWFHPFASLGVDVPFTPDPSDLVDPIEVDQGRSPFVERRGGEGLGPLSAAREQTIASLTAGWTALQDDDPEWFRGLMEDIANPSSGASFDEATSPSYWIGQLLRNMPQLAEFLADTSLEGIAAGCDAAASVLPGTQPVFDAITLMIADLEPQLDEVVTQMETAVRQQEVDLASLQAIAVRVEAGLAELRGLADPAGTVHGASEEMIAMLLSLRVEPSEFALPPWAPLSIVDALIVPLNEGIDAAIASVRALEDQVASSWQASVAPVIAAVEAKVELFRAAVAEGGALHLELEAQLASFQEQVERAAEALRGWDGVVTFDVNAAVGFLRSVAAAARAAAAAEGPEGRRDPWPAILHDVALPAIEAWRARHAAEVEQQYHPKIPEGEMAACRGMAAEIVADPHVSAEARRAVEAAWEEVRAYEGAQGRAALYGFWRAEQAFASAVSAARPR